MKHEKYAVTWRIIPVASVIDQVIAEIIFWEASQIDQYT